MLVSEKGVSGKRPCGKKTLIHNTITNLRFSISCNSSKVMSTKCSISELLHKTNWMLRDPAAPIHKISLYNSTNFSFSNDPLPILPLTRKTHEEGDAKGSSIYVVRDDLLHPLVNGNKARKLDALIPILQHQSVTDVVTCGGSQSAHAAAVAVSCAERGIRSHLLLRGEQPEIPSGYNLVSLMYGNVTYVPRPMYARREEMLIKHAKDLVCSGGCILHSDDILAFASDGSSLGLDRSLRVLPQVNSQKGLKRVVIVSEGAGDVVALLDDILVFASDGSSLGLDRSLHVLPQVNSQKGLKRVVIVSEGAGDVVALLGLIRLVKYLSQAHVFGKEQEINFVVDAGTGTTAVGLALGALYFRLPWKVTAIMLADTIERYKEKERCLISDFRRIYQFESFGQTVGNDCDNIVHWVDRVHPRKFGKVLKGEIQLCREISQQTGILLDPIYTLAAWEQSILSLSEVDKDTKVVMVHTGGTLGLFGLAQRYASHFYPFSRSDCTLNETRSKDEK